MAQAKSKRSNTKCKNCKKVRHIKANFYLKGGGKEGQAPWQKKKKAEAAKATTTNNEKSPASSNTKVIMPSCQPQA
jgi:hypothetical protein